MKISICQFDIRWGDKNRNIERVESFAHAAQGEVIFLPETFTTGFGVEPATHAETMQGTTVQHLRRIAAESGKALVGSIIVESAGQIYNRMLFVKPDGRVDYYDKRHLFSIGGEGDNFSKGQRRVVVEYRGVRFLLEVCYDLRFPVWSRYEGDYDVIVYCASWPESRIEVWDTLLKARALENQSYVIGVNRVGSDPLVASYSGSSQLVDSRGRVRVAADDSEGIFEGLLDIEMQNEFRDKFPVLRDADPFCIDGRL